MRFCEVKHVSAKAKKGLRLHNLRQSVELKTSRWNIHKCPVIVLSTFAYCFAGAQLIFIFRGQTTDFRAAQANNLTGLPFAGLPGELCGLGGWAGLVAGAGLTGGLCALATGNSLITLVVVPPPSNTPESSSLLDSGSEVGSVVVVEERPGGVESGLGGLGPTSDILGDEGLTRSGDEVLVSATDSPRSGYRQIA